MRSPRETEYQGQEAAGTSSGGAATAATPPASADGGAIAGAVGPGPVSVVITLHVAPTREAAFEEAERRVLAAVVRRPGYLAHNVLRGPAGPTGRDYDIIFRFTDEASWQSWHDSEERREVVGPLFRIAEQRSRRSWTGLEAWFDLPDTLPPPSRHRMTLLTWCAIWPLVTFVFWVLGPVIMGWALPMRTLAITAVVVPTMTYGVMPNLTRWLAPWLTAAPKSQD